MYLELLMRRSILPFTALLMVAGCSNIKQNKSAASEVFELPEQGNVQQCVGEVVAPPIFVPLLTEVDDIDIVAGSVKANGEGGLCKAKAYRVNKPFEIYRAWNSNNPASEKGNWWSFSMPSGKMAEYRRDYAICPKWSPLDMMTRCIVKQGTHLVLGTGQSAMCNPFLTYKKSPGIQIYIENAGQSTMECKSYFGMFSWQEVD